MLSGRSSVALVAGYHAGVSSTLICYYLSLRLYSYEYCTRMGLEVVALIVAAATAVPVAFAYGFGLAAPNSGVASSITDTSPCVSHSSDFIVCGGSRWQASIGRGTVCRSTFLSMAKGSEHDAPRRFGLTMEDSTRVSRALNRALGRILSTGDMFGSVGGKSLSDGETCNKWSSSTRM